MSIFGNQNYKQVVQLALRAKKLTNEQMAKGKFQKNKSFGFMSEQFSKKSRSFESSGNSSGSSAEAVSSPQIVRPPPSSRLGTSPSNFAFKGRPMIERCSRCHQFHSDMCSMSQGVCFNCGQSGNLKKNCPMLTSTASAGQTLGQPRALAVSSGRAAGRHSGSVKSAARSSSRTQSMQRPQRTQTHIFAMTIDEA